VQECMLLSIRCMLHWDCIWVYDRLHNLCETERAGISHMRNWHSTIMYTHCYGVYTMLWCILIVMVYKHCHGVHTLAWCINIAMLYTHCHCVHMLLFCTQCYGVYTLSLCTPCHSVQKLCHCVHKLIPWAMV